MGLAENTRSEGIFGWLHLAIALDIRSVVGRTTTDVSLILITPVKAYPVKVLTGIGLGKQNLMIHRGRIDGKITYYYHL